MDIVDVVKGIIVIGSIILFFRIIGLLLKWLGRGISLLFKWIGKKKGNTPIKDNTHRNKSDNENWVTVVHKNPENQIKETSQNYHSQNYQEKVIAPSTPKENSKSPTPYVPSEPPTAYTKFNYKEYKDDFYKSEWWKKISRQYRESVCTAPLNSGHSLNQDCGIISTT